MTALERVVKAGIDWLLHTDQPNDAWLQHHGMTAPAVDNLRLWFVPVGARGAPVVVVNRDKYTYDERGEPNSPLTDDDMAVVQGAIQLAGATVQETWNGPPAITGSFGLAERANRALLEAVGRYLAGCPDHGGSVFCSHGPPHAPEPCDWYARGYKRVKQPEWPA